VLGSLLAKRLSQGRGCARQRSQDLLGYLLPYTLPALICLPLTLYVSHFLQASVGRALALCLAYATSSGIFSTSMLLCVVVMFNVGHKRPAVRIIRDYCPKPLFLIGFLAALSDALTSPQIARQLGGNITSSVAVFTGLIASIIFGLLVIRLRRPVAHLIRNRPLAQRLKQPSLQESLRIFSGLWYWPIRVDGAGLGGQSDRHRRGQSKGPALRVVHHGVADRHGVPQHHPAAPVQVAQSRSDPAQQRLQGTLSQPVARLAADRHGDRLHRYSRADLGRFAARFRPEQHGRPGDQQCVEQHRPDLPRHLAVVGGARHGDSGSAETTGQQTLVAPAQHPGENHPAAAAQRNQNHPGGDLRDHHHG
jgi:hypothetical protein